MAININQNYSQFYTGRESIKNYGAKDGAGQKDTLVKYEFNTTDKYGNKIMAKMSREETLQAMNAISAQYGDNVIVEFSGDAMAALAESLKVTSDESGPQDEASNSARQAAFDNEVVQLNGNADYLPEYSGMYNVDKAIATAVENSSNEEQAFVYDIVRQNFLVSNSNSMSEKERQANISLGMKKAEYAADNFIAEEHKVAFLEAMESIAKLASAGKADENGTMNYGVNKENNLGHGSNLVNTDDSLDMMRTMDAKAYDEYQKINEESSNEDKPLNTLKYLTNWYQSAVKKNPDMVDEYKKQSDEYIEKNVTTRKLDTTFADINTESKVAFIESLRAFQKSNPDFLTRMINNELSSNYWK